MPYRSTEIANEFLSLPELSGKLTQMHLQKLVYFANGWNFVVNGGPLVSDKAEAWDYGPVYKGLYEHTKYFGKEKINKLIVPSDGDAFRFFLTGARESEEPYKANLSAEEMAVIHGVAKRYGGLSGIKMSRLTHEPDTPWYRAYKRGKNSVLQDSDIKEHYMALATKANAA